MGRVGPGCGQVGRGGVNANGPVGHALPQQLLVRASGSAADVQNSEWLAAVGQQVGDELAGSLLQTLFKVAPGILTSLGGVEGVIEVIYVSG